jgi:hypothetical protein
MRISGVSRCAFGICAAAALLAGCGGSQPPIGAAGRDFPTRVLGLLSSATFSYRDGYATFTTERTR